MTNFQDVVEYRGSGILFSTRKGLRGKKLHNDSVALNISYRARESSPKALSRLYRPRNFSPPCNISEATKNDRKNRTLLNPTYLFRYFYDKSKKFFDIDTADVRQFYLSTPFLFFFFLVFLSMPYAVNRVFVALFLCLLFPLFNFSLFASLLALTLAFLTVEITIITSRIRDKRRDDSLLLPSRSSYPSFVRYSPPPPISRRPHTESTGLVLFSLHIESSPAGGRTLGGLHRVRIAAKVGETPLEN